MGRWLDTQTRSFLKSRVMHGSGSCKVTPRRRTRRSTLLFMAHQFTRSIHYSETFLNVLAFVLRNFKGMDGAKVVNGGIPGVIRYDPHIADRSFRRIDDLFMQLGMISKRGETTKKPRPA